MRHIRMLFVLIILAVLAAPTVGVGASPATGSSVAEFVVTGERPPRKPETKPTPTHYVPHDRLPGTSSRRHLPQTGDVQNGWVGLLGAVMICGFAWVIVKRRGERE